MKLSKAERHLKAQFRQYGAAAVLAERAGAVSVSALAAELGIARTVFIQACSSYRGRKYRHVRRSIEAHLGMRQYVLDHLIEEDTDAPTE
jgi:hypothetical protein